MRPKGGALNKVCYARSCVLGYTRPWADTQMARDDMISDEKQKVRSGRATLLTFCFSLTTYHTS